MKIKLFFTIMLFMLISIFFTTSVKADEVKIPGIFEEEYQEEFNPNKEIEPELEPFVTPFTNSTVYIVNTILGFLQIVGAISMVFSIIIFGLNRILSVAREEVEIFGIVVNGNADALQESRDFLRNLIIGTAILFFSSTIVKFVFDIFVET